MIYQAEIYLLAPSGDALDFRPLRTPREADTREDAVEDLVGLYAVPSGGEVRLIDWRGRETRHVIRDGDVPLVRKPRKA